jgi:hypothetical protein
MSGKVRGNKASRSEAPRLSAFACTANPVAAYVPKELLKETEEWQRMHRPGTATGTECPEALSDKKRTDRKETKRNTKTGQFIDQKADGRKFKGVRREKS